MSFKDIFNTVFSYAPPIDYQFNISNDVQNESLASENTSKKINIYPSLSVNEEYMKTKYNTLINSDVILRNFTINARGRQYNAFIVYIDGMVNSQILDEFILQPLMLRNKSNTFDGLQNRVISEAVANNITVRKVKKFDLPNYLMSCLIPQNAVEQVKDFESVAIGINSRQLCIIC